MKNHKNPKIAVAQIRYFDISKRNNVEKIKRYIRKAKKLNADIVCFPESCVHKTEALYFNDSLIREIKEECKKNSIWCIITEDLEIRKKKYNTAMLIDREGNIKGNYKKIHLYGDKVKAGSRVRIFKTDFAKIGIAICWDLAFPKLFRQIKEAGAEIVFCPSQWEYESRVHKDNPKAMEVKLLESLILSRAFENVYFVAVCNPVVDSKFQVSYSAIAGPHKILKKIVGREGLIVSKINLKEIKKVEEIYNN
jgi:predicted amidohydrolase